ncbi:hypothetical protein MTR67_022183, partial [Solanum verrucosum]
MPIREEYLGHVISIQVKLRPSSSGLPPKNIKEIHSFIGLAGYYHRFIHHYAAIAGPLTDFLRKYAFVWDVTALIVFETLKDKLSSMRYLALPNFSQEFQLETDASGRGIGAVLSQIGHAVAYFSQKLSTRMQGASNYHREMFTITQAVSYATPEQQKWLSKLVGYDFQIMYRPGKLNQAADALSRTSEGVLMAFSSRICNLEHELRALLFPRC